MTADRNIVLLLTHSADHYTIDRVAEELASRGARPRRIDTDDFPMTLLLQAGLDAAGSRHGLRDAVGDITGEEVCAVWVRRLMPPRLDESLAEMEPLVRDGCLRESSVALMGFLDGFCDRRILNPPAATQAAENKLRQLRLARSQGLTLPRTLVTNDPDAVRAFYTQLDGQLITKMLTPLSQSMDGRSPFVHTSPVSAADLEDLDGLCYSPMVFQERIDKAHELRVAVVGRRCFAASIDATRSQSGQVDWRSAAVAEVSWQPAELPPLVAARLTDLVAALGLVYGAADLIVTPQGEHVFLEVNPAGEWGMLERDAGLPIAAALAEALLDDPR